VNKRTLGFGPATEVYKDYLPAVSSTSELIGALRYLALQSRDTMGRCTSSLRLHVVMGLGLVGLVLSYLLLGFVMRLV
jgi:hypothetical protein